jgi:hypothetical protein
VWQAGSASMRTGPSCSESPFFNILARAFSAAGSFSNDAGLTSSVVPGPTTSRRVSTSRWSACSWQTSTRPGAAIPA